MCPLLWLICCGAGCDLRLPLDEVRVALASDPVRLDPRFTTDASGNRINRLIFLSLVDFNQAMQPIPQLAHWQLLTPIQYRFTLSADGRTFSDGSRLTSAHVKSTYDHVLDESMGSPHRATLALNIREIRVVDDNQIDFLLRRPDPLLPSRLTVGIVKVNGPPGTRYSESNLLGSGPFELIARSEREGVLLARKRDNLKVRFIKISDPTVRALKLQRAEVDLAQNDFPAEIVQYLASLPHLKVESAAGNNFSYIGFNLRQEPTSNLKLRQAIAQAIDRQRIIEYLYADLARPAESILPSHHWAGTQLSVTNYAPHKAIALLNELGYDTQHPLEITFKTSNDPFRIRLATVLQSMLGRVGIKMEIQSFDWGTFYGDIKSGRFSLYSLAWVGIKTPDIYRYLFHSASVPPGGANRGGLQDSTLDRLIEAAEAAPTLELQSDLYAAVAERVHQQLPYVPLWYEHNVLITNCRIKGYRLAADGQFDSLTNVEIKQACDA